LDYAKNYERCCLEDTSAFQRLFMGVLTRRAKSIGQDSHRIWSLKYLIDNYFQGKSGLRIMDCGAWNGWFLSYQNPAIEERIALDFDVHFAQELRDKGIGFILADMEKGAIPVETGTLDLVSMTSTLEHLSCPEHIASEIGRVLKPGGIVFITVPDIMKYKFHFWDDVTHKRPFNKTSLRFLFETHGMETLELSPYNHNLFIAGNLFPPAIHRRMTRFRANALMYVGRKPLDADGAP
jgi:SAM-dependent methyltransferase